MASSKADEQVAHLWLERRLGTSLKVVEVEKRGKRCSRCRKRDGHPVRVLERVCGRLCGSERVVRRPGEPEVEEVGEVNEVEKRGRSESRASLAVAEIESGSATSSYRVEGVVSGSQEGRGEDSRVDSRHLTH